MVGRSDIFSRVVKRAKDVIPRLSCHGRTKEECDTLGAILHEVKRFGQVVDGARIDACGALGVDLLRATSERGLFGLTVPEGYDGAGLSLSAATRVADELSYINGSLATCVALHSGLALYSLVFHANEGLRQKYMPDIAAGKRIAAFCATEPEAGSDIAAVRTLLYRDEQGKLRLRGTKCYVTNGGLAGILTVVARSPQLGDARSGHTLVMVDPTWKGVLRQAEEHKLGLKGSSTITIDFDDVEIPPDHVIGGYAVGLDLAYEALTWGRTFMASACLGSARAAIDETREHVGRRVQFGKALDQFPLVRQQLAEAQAKAYAVSATLGLVCDTFDSREDDIMIASTILKVFASEQCWSVIDACVQLMGGAGFIEDTGMPRRLRDVRVTRIFEGANDVLRLHLATSSLQWSRASLSQMPSLASQVPEKLQPMALRFDEVAKVLVRCLVEVHRKYAFRLFYQQVLQARMADAIIALYAMLAVILRASSAVTSLNGSNGSNGAQDADVRRQLAMAQLAIMRLEQHVRHAIEAMESATDKGVAALVNDVWS